MLLYYRFIKIRRRGYHIHGVRNSPIIKANYPYRNVIGEYYLPGGGPIGPPGPKGCLSLRLAGSLPLPNVLNLYVKDTMK